MQITGMDLSSVVMSPHLAIPMRTQTRKCHFKILRLCSIAVASAFAVKHIRSYHPRRRSKPRAYRSRTTSTVCPRPRPQSPRSRSHEARRAYSVQSSTGTMRCAPPPCRVPRPESKVPIAQPPFESVSQLRLRGVPQHARR